METENNSIFPVKETGKRYNTYDSFLKKKFSSKVAKLPLDAGFTCPNRDGKKAFFGCTFCSSSGSGDFCAKGSIKEQLEIQKEILSKKWKTDKFIPYFQAGSGTYAPIKILKEKYYEALSFEGTVGLDIATRADCLNDEVCSLLKEISEKTFLCVELGLQSVFDETAKIINRGHSYEEFKEGYYKLKNMGISVCVHLINGLPGENRQMMLESAKRLSLLEPDFVKIHLLHVLKNTALEKDYSSGNLRTLEKDEYVDIVCSQIEYFPATTVFERLTGDGKFNDLIAPAWSKRKREVLNSIDMELKRRESFQGIKYFKEK